MFFASTKYLFHYVAVFCIEITQVVELQQECFEELKSVILTTALSRGGVFRDVNQVEKAKRVKPN